MAEEKPRSPNFDDREIPVEFLLLHYTAGDLATTLDLFHSRAAAVSAHLVISASGEVHELVPCLEGVALRAWHAGVSRFDDGRRVWQGFNDFSIGVELENLNGNLFPYTTAQYAALQRVTTMLKRHFPALGSPARVLGHEHVAGFRGKADPGRRFDWKRFYKRCYRQQPAPVRLPVCPPSLVTALGVLVQSVAERSAGPPFWHALSSMTETAVALAHTKGEPCRG